MVHPHVWENEVVYLVQPQHIGTKFTQDNKQFRSSLWNEDGELISAGFPKFVNWGENPEHFPTPEKLSGCVFVEKIDGSLLIVSKYKGKFILRTRGTIDASKLDNGHEIELFKTDILPKVENIHLLSGDTWNYSVLFEWTSPENRIVVRYGDNPTWSLVGIIHHGDYSLIDQLCLDNLAWQHGLTRPHSYKFTTIAEFLDIVAKWEGKEGAVCYSKNGQMLHKAKSDWYKIRHRLKEEFSNFEKVLDFYISEKCPDYNTFYNRIAGIVDFETAEEIRGDISRCVDASKEVQRIVYGFNHFICEKLLPLGDPKDKKIRGQQAGLVLQSYGNTNRASFIFKALDGKNLDDDDLKKLFYQVLKK